MNDRPSMTDQQMVKDYPRLKYEYSQLHQDYKKLKRKLSERQKPTEANNNPDTKPLIIGDVSGLLFDFWHYTKNGNDNDTPADEIKEGVEMFLSNYKR